MDRRVKQRLIGATILIALIVIIVPALLSGPRLAPVTPLAANAPATTRTVEVDLSTQEALPASAPQPAAPAPGGGAAPPAAAAPSGGAAPASAPEPAGGTVTPAAPPQSRQANPPLTVMTLKAQDSTAPAAVETQSSSPKSQPGGGIWAVQLGSFASKVNADKLVHQMKAAGSPVYVVPSGSGASLRYRVRVGPLADRGSAEHAMQKLKASGHPATLVTPAS